MKFYIETLGCQMNVNDSDKMAEFLSKNGLQRIDNYIDADMVIVNTCSVRFSAEHKAYSLLGRWKELKDEKPNLIIGVTGCMAQYDRPDSLCWSALLSKAQFYTTVIYWIWSEAKLNCNKG